jgi:hypothetical protein
LGDVIWETRLVNGAKRIVDGRRDWTKGIDEGTGRRE